MSGIFIWQHVAYTLYWFSSFWFQILHNVLLNSSTVRSNILFNPTFFWQLMFAWSSFSECLLVFSMKRIYWLWFSSRLPWCFNLIGFPAFGRDRAEFYIVFWFHHLPISPEQNQYVHIFVLFSFIYLLIPFPAAFCQGKAQTMIFPHMWIIVDMFFNRLIICL